MILRDCILILALCISFDEAIAADNRPVFVPVPGSSIRLETFVYQPSGTGRSADRKFPVLIYNHGSSGGNPKLSIPARHIADYFVNRGFIVVVPMRRGRGNSSGESPEPEDRNCDPDYWKPGLRASSEDLSAVFEYVALIPQADPSSVILAGASRGGFLSVAYAAGGKYRQNIVGVINFVGGWVGQTDGKCGIDFNYVSFARFGAETRVPMLWLYGSPDIYYASRSVMSYHRVFAATGGNVRFRLIHGVPRNGHWLPGYPDLWARPVGSFLASLRENSH